MIKTRAITLHRFPYSDSSFIVKALTEECGVVSFIIKGGKRKESPFKGALDPLALSEVVFRQNPSTELQFIKEASIIDWHANLRQSLLNLAEAQVMAEILLRYAPAGSPLVEEFALLEESLKAFDSPTPPEGVFARWLLATSEFWGYQLDLGTCSRCEKTLTEPAVDFFPESGALICKDCQGVVAPRARAETMNGLWELHRCEFHTEPNSSKIPIFLPGREFVENALLGYLRNHIGFVRDIHSLSWLQEVRKLCSVQSK